jgi:tight adherence protein C
VIEVLLLLIGIACLGGAAFLVGEVASAPVRERQNSVHRAVTYGRMRVGAGTARRRFRERVLVPLGEWLAAWVLRVNPRTNVDSVRLKLLGAGLGGRITPTQLLAAKALFAVVGVVCGMLLGSALSGIGAVLLLGLAFGAGGFVAPDTVVSAKGRARRERVRGELPDALDLLAVSVEAGLGFDGALAKLTEHMEGPLTEEFALMLSEIRIGESRQDALKRMSDRIAVPEVASFTRSIIQADQLGTSLSRILRVQAADTRLRRQAAAEEKAMKAPIKMLFPTVLFIFPAMFLVILGPAFLNLAELF